VIVSFHPAAEVEYESALTRLAGEAGVRIAEDFASEFWRTIDLIRRRPELGAPAPRTTRKLTLRQFRYNIIYRVEPEAVRILAVAHHHRRPGYWAHRR
jgi:plasmid stabilization system protein ParE